MLKDNEKESKLVVEFKREMLCCGRKKGRETASDIATSPRRQNLAHGVNNTVVIRPKDPPPMIIQGDFRKVSGISNEIFRQIETIENEYDASTAAALETVERRGEMIVRILDTKHLGKAAAEAAKKFLSLQDSKHTVLLVEIIKRPGQTLGLYIREGNGLDRSDGVFISRIALESAVYNSGCIQVGDEILAVNLVDVTRMSIDDVVIIMSIPRRLVLVTRQAKGYPVSGSLTMGAVSHTRLPEPKPPPVVVIKKDLSKEEDFDDDEEEKHSSLIKANVTKDSWRNKEKSRSHITLDSNGDLETDLYYNSRPKSQHHQTCTLDRRISGWTYTPQPGALEHYFKQTNNLPMTCDRNYPKTLESLAEKVHPFCPGGSTLGRRTSETALSSKYSHSTLRKTGITRSGSDQHLPRTEHDDFRNTVGRTLPMRHTQTLLRSGIRGWSTTTGSSYGSRQGTLPPSTSFDSSLSRSHRVDYASDNEISYPAASKSASYYYCRPSTAQTISGISSSTLSRLNKSGALSRAASLRSNSLPRDTRITKNHLTSVSMINPMNNVLCSNSKYGTNTRTTVNNLLEREDDGALSAPELPPADKFRRSTYLNSTSNVFTSDEYRAWLSRTPSTSAIYDKLKYSREPNFLRQKNRFTFSAENIPEKTNQSSIGMTPLPSATVSTLDRHTRTSSLRRIRHLQELEAKHLGNRSITPDLQVDRSRVLEINTSEFTKYKLERTHLADEYPSVSGLLWIHLLAGRGLRATAAASPSFTGPNNITRDLYCVLECDRVHKARTIVRNGDLVFDWDETFELDLFSNRELDFLVYSWDPQLRHKLCYKGSIHLCSLVSKSPVHQLALKVEPRGTLYIRLRYTDAIHTYLRRINRPAIPAKNLLSANCLFGVDLETVVNREYETMSSPFDPVINDETSLSSSVPIIVRRCVQEVEKRGLDIIGLYRLCGSATKKRILREAFERNPRTIDLSPDNVPDLNVITGVFKDYLRELPEPLFTKHLYQMIVDALSVCMSDDPQGNAKLIFSLLDCLTKINKATLIFIMDHLSLVVSQVLNNKMSPQNLSIIFAPLLMIKSHPEDKEIDFNQPINILRYLLEVWPSKSVREIIIGPEKVLVAPMVRPPPLPKKPNVVSVHGGGPLPVPSKGIRRPPPAVPARFTPAAVASLTNDNSSSSASSSSDGGGNEMDANTTARINGRNELYLNSNSNESSELSFLPTSRQGSAKEASFRDVQLADSPNAGHADVAEVQSSEFPRSPPSSGNSSSNPPVNTQTHSKLSSMSKSMSDDTLLTSIHQTSSSKHTSRSNENEFVNGYSFQNITCKNDTVSGAGKTNSTKIEEALKQVSTCSKAIPSAFGHSRVDESCSSVEEIAKVNVSSWNDVVESWIKENESVADGIASSVGVKSFSHSHKNPFLADLRSSNEADTSTNSINQSFANGFSFCVDSSNTSTS